jgi:carboxyl-terminal processing protease
MPLFPARHRPLCLLVLLLAAAPLVRAEPAKPSPLPLDAMKNMAAAFGLIRSDYVTAVDGDRLIASCTKGMFKELDPASAYLDGESLADLRGRRGSDVGIGVELTLRAGLPTVAAALEGSPADRAGLRPRDYILEIDGESMEETTLEQALARLRGKPGSELTLTVRRPGDPASRTVTVTRAATEVKPVFARRWGADLGYLRVRSLREGTPREVHAAVLGLQQSRPLKGLVLDLRNSPGGLLQSAIEIAAMFLPDRAVVVRTEGRLPESNQTYTADREVRLKAANGAPEAWHDTWTKMPVVVLVDGGTASGAEIIAAALRDNGRARLLGSRTFGRGSIQTLRMISPDSAVKLTTALYRTPGGQQLQGRGLIPDETLPDLERLDQAGTDKDPLLLRAATLLDPTGR